MVVQGTGGNIYPKGKKPSEFLFQYARRLTDIEGNTFLSQSPQGDQPCGRLLDNMAHVTIDTRPIRSLQSDKSLAGSTYESLLEARERKPDVPVVPKRTSDFVFVRYIGHPEMEINRPFLEERGRYFVLQIQSGADVFIFCYSPDNMIAPYLCQELYQRVAKDVIKPDVPEQPSLF